MYDVEKLKYESPNPNTDASSSFLSWCNCQKKYDIGIRPMILQSETTHV